MGLPMGYGEFSISLIGNTHQKVKRDLLFYTDNFIRNAFAKIHHAERYIGKRS